MRGYIGLSVIHVCFATALFGVTAGCSGIVYGTDHVLATEASGPSGAPLARIRRHLSTVQVVTLGSPQDYAGHYSSTPPELIKLVASLTGRELYLFPDGSYLTTEWGCVLPETIVDKGTWGIDNGIVSLSCDSSITWQVSTEQRYVALKRSGKRDELLLVGLGRDLSYFESNGDDDPSFVLMLCSMARTETWTDAQAQRVRAKLLSDSWNPELFADSKGIP